MKEVLVLTGWGYKGYIAAAAIAQKSIKEAIITPISKGKIANFLLDIKEHSQSLKTIYILGVCLLSDPPLILEVCKGLSGKGIKIIYLSSFPLPEWYPEELYEYIQLIYMDLPIESICEQHFCMNAERIKTLAYGLSYEPFIEATAYAYRTTQDLGAYRRMICHISREEYAQKWLENDKNLIEHFKQYGHRELIGKSEPMQELRQCVSKIAPTDGRVMILGETGTGKETIALQLYQQSKRKGEDFFAFNCASVNESLLESAFLGYEKGAFTGANERKAGLFESANGGTLFLDEIGDLPLNVQGVLLRVLEEGRLTRIGGTQEIKVNVRLITATNRNLVETIQQGRFREDLFYRLNVFSIRVPPLRAHFEDLEEIVNHFWYKKANAPFPKKELKKLKEYPWYGNVRELYHFLERLILFGTDETCQLLTDHIQNLKGLYSKNDSQFLTPQEFCPLNKMISKYITNAFHACQKNYTHTAELLNISKNTVKKYLSQEE